MREKGETGERNNGVCPAPDKRSAEGVKGR